MQLIDSSERADTLLSKGTGVGFKPVVCVDIFYSFLSFTHILLISRLLNYKYIDLGCSQSGEALVKDKICDCNSI